MIRSEYPKCPCAACQAVMKSGEGPRKPCLFGRTFDARGNIMPPALIPAESSAGA